MTVKPTRGLLYAKITSLGNAGALVELEFDHPVEFTASMVESHPQLSLCFRDDTCDKGESFRVVFVADPAIPQDAIPIRRGKLFQQAHVQPKRTIYQFTLVPIEETFHLPVLASFQKQT